MNPAQGSSQAQTEIADMQQRMRVGSDALFKELVMAGAGVYQGVDHRFADQLLRADPSAQSGDEPDPPTVFRPDAISITYIPNSYSQTTILRPMPRESQELKVNDPTRRNAPRRTSCAASRKEWSS